MSSPDSSSRGWLSPVWFIPLLAAVVSGWLLYRQHQDRGPVIHVEFANGAGLEAGKTPLIYKGVVVGRVESVSLQPDLRTIRAEVELAASAAGLAVEGSEFWLVRPEVGLSGVHGLDTLLSGARMHVRAGTGQPVRRFTARAVAPVDDGIAVGRSYVLRSPRLASLHPGSGIYYREVKVGVVASHRLAPDATHVLVTIHLFAPYHQLVRRETRFWNSGGLSMKVGLLGAQVRSDSLESLVSGGVSLATPDDAASGEPPPDGAVFDLHEKAESAWTKWEPRITLASP